jgi:hypothetical protein
MREGIPLGLSEAFYVGRELWRFRTERSRARWLAAAGGVFNSAAFGRAKNNRLVVEQIEQLMAARCRVR